MGKFYELAKTKISENKNVVISVDREGKISIAQQLVVNDNGKEQNIFLKNAIVMDAASFMNFKDSMNEAVEKFLKKK